MDTEEVKIDLEDQFLLRLPIVEARKLRELMRSKPDKIKKVLKMELKIDENVGTLQFSKNKLHGVLKKLPTVIESYKTNICNDKSTMFKTADICQMFDTTRYMDTTQDTDKKKSNRKDVIHGYCAPLKNIKSKRFRKTMYNKDFAIEAESVTKELYYLLSTDLEAVSSKFEILYEGNSNTSSKQYEKSLFGQLSSDSELSENSN